MDAQTLAALVGGAAVLLGTAVGGLISFFSSRSVRRMEWELALTEKNILNRESLYAEFLTEANRLMLLSVDRRIAQSTELTTLISIEAKIWFHSEIVGKTAREIAKCILDQHSKEPKGSDPGFPKLRDRFIAEGKEDIRNLRKHA
jgi:hypothetical protein